MANPLQSKPHFRERAREYGVSERLIDELKDQGVESMGQLAFAIFRPGAEFDEQAFNQWAVQLNSGMRPTMGELAGLRRLHFESEVVATASLKASIEATDPGAPKPIPVAERSARLNEQRARLGGVSISGMGEPSHTLVDEICNQFETRVLRYVEPSRCTSRETEVTTGKSDKKLKLDTNTLTIKESKSVPDESISTTFHLAQCLKRRGLAYDFAGLISFDAHERYVEKLLRHLSIDAPPGYHPTTLSQVLRADREVFAFMAQNVHDIRPVGNVKPLDDQLVRALQDYNTVFHLLPLPKTAAREDTSSKNPARENVAPYRKGQGKNKGGGKNKSGGSLSAPRGMVGCVGRDAKNRPICFDFNLSTCSNAAVGAACSKGRHCCFKAGCFRNHAYKDAHATEMPQKEGKEWLSADKDFTHAVVLELFCGTAGVSASFKKKGFTNAIAVDKIIPKFPKSNVTKIDLTVRANQLLVLEWIASPFVEAIYMSPPCGTASMARNIAMPDEPNAPEPLRSILQPDGLDSLCGTDLQRVSLANVLYDFSAEVWDLCCSIHKPCMLENPSNSLFFFTTPWRERRFASSEYLQHHQACAYGSSRPKWTLLASNFPEVHMINATCPGNHKHASWGLIQQGAKRVFATALEVHYPQGLCDAISHAFVVHLLQKGFHPPNPSPTNADAKAFSGVPVATALPALIPEYKAKVARLCTNDGQQLWPAQPIVDGKLLHSSSIGGIKGAGDQELFVCCNAVLDAWRVDFKFSNVDFHSLTLTDNSRLEVFGIFWTEDEFVELAQNFQHPLDPKLAMPEILIKEVRAQVNDSDVEIARHRAIFFKTWTARALELAKEEESLKQTMDPWVSRAAGNKRLLVFKEMLSTLGYPDLGVYDELVAGASLIGDVDSTGMLPCKYVPALTTEKMLRENARLVRKKIMHEPGSSGDAEIDKAVWEKTLEEVSRGWLLGPLEQADIEADAPVSRRFGLVQKRGKVRLIDDYTESGINGCVTVCESPILHTVDIACAMLRFWFESCRTANRDPGLHTRTFDLTSAYRQIGLNKLGRRYSYLRVFDPSEGRLRIFQATVLPFGSVRSVHTFLRCARALWWLGVVGCRFLWTSFYDDFISFSRPSLVNSTQLAITAFFKLTGWLFAEDGDKCSPFGFTCEALGVVFNLHDSALGVAKICNTASRVNELCEDLEEVLRTKVLSSKAAQKLRGRMQFADAQVFGKTGRRCLRVLADFTEGRRHRLSNKDLFFISLFRDMLRSDRPREVRATGCRSAVLLTDACYERDSRELVCGLGGVLILPNGRKAFFSASLDVEMRQVLGELYKKQIIFEAETLAAVLALRLWLSEILEWSTFLFVDNEGCKFALLKGFADNEVVDKLAEIFVEVESSRNLYIWISRVPSKSNMSDKPSRGHCDDLLKHGYENFSNAAADILADLIRILKLGWCKANKPQLKKEELCDSSASASGLMYKQLSNLTRSYCSKWNMFISNVAFSISSGGRDRVLTNFWAAPTSTPFTTKGEWMPIPLPWCKANKPQLKKEELCDSSASASGLMYKNGNALLRKQLEKHIEENTRALPRKLLAVFWGSWRWFYSKPPTWHATASALRFLFRLFRQASAVLYFWRTKLASKKYRYSHCFSFVFVYFKK